jgi:hypothetical protein
MNEQQDFAEAHFKELGPIPRICINFVKDPSVLIGYKNYRQAMVTRLTPQSLRAFVLDGGVLDLDANSHAIFLVKRNEIDDLERAYLEPISPNVEMQLMMAINNLQRLEQIDLYYAFTSIDPTKGVAGLVYKSLGHTLIQEGITLTLKPAIKRKERKHFYWKSQGEDPASNSMDLDGPEPVSFPPNIGIVYEELRSVKPNCLYVPKARNEVALDPFFILGEFLYILQFTVANNHDIKKGIEKSLSRLVDVLPPKTKWRFVFITPPGCEVDVKVTLEVEKFLDGATLFSAHLKIEEAHGPTIGTFSTCVTV